MRIGTWNVERLCRKKRLAPILECCKQVDADILVLTETDRRIHPAYPYAYHTPLLAEAVDEDYYRPTENRVSIFSRYPCIRQHSVADANTSLCVELATGRGPLLVYGTILGTRGNREASFKIDVLSQMMDVRRLTNKGHAVCLVGDFNCSFLDNYYFTAWGRNTISYTFHDCAMELLTEKQPECIDHIAISRSFVKGAPFLVKEWNLDKTLSDHKGIGIRIWDVDEAIDIGAFTEKERQDMAQAEYDRLIEWGEERRGQGDG